MAKREYIQANKDWLEEKAKEDGVKALPKGIYYKVLNEGDQASTKPTVRSIITAHYTGRTVCLWLVACVTLSKAGLSPSNRCILVTSGRFISLPKWVTASSRSQAFLVVRRLSLKLNC